MTDKPTPALLPDIFDVEVLLSSFGVLVIFNSWICPESYESTIIITSD